ncbi:DUF2787 family protein [Neptuniibacter sp.]|uniref:DUF2787 family protein n=1 Tax=Neptuniibacter sp. TaxID=1962643 RepID=UPI002613BA4F|nr:DUF2787 family protein [Neptuniibacter sp.]MCP4595423.1 DUF2787 domain-containing protein [Neptuniibacter sp.]
MKLPILTDGLVLPVSHQLIELLNDELDKVYPTLDPLSGTETIVFNFRDPDYSAELGGYHPVEIGLSRHQSGFELDYLTDFSFVGSGWDTELAKEIDFDVHADICTVRYAKPVSLIEAKELFNIFQENFISYYHLNVFNVEVTAEKIDER